MTKKDKKKDEGIKTIHGARIKVLYSSEPSYRFTEGVMTGLQPIVGPEDLMLILTVEEKNEEGETIKFDRMIPTHRIIHIDILEDKYAPKLKNEEDQLYA
jgi:hypothetical protein